MPKVRHSPFLSPVSPVTPTPAMTFAFFLRIFQAAAFRKIRSSVAVDRKPLKLGRSSARMRTSFDDRPSASAA